jgi:hypothetical protein
MRLSRVGVQQLLNDSVVELGFTRRHEKAGWPMGRRMFCTLNKRITLSLPGRMSLNFRPPTHPPAYPAYAYGLVCVWDIFWQDWRMVPLETMNIISVIPTRTKKEQEQFWAYFSEFLARLTPPQKEAFMKRA